MARPSDQISEDGYRDEGDAGSFEPSSGDRLRFVGRIAAVIAVATSALSLGPNLVPVGGIDRQAAAAVCEARGDTLYAAKSAYGQTCSEPRVDCDPGGDGWVCSSEQIGTDTPTDSDPVVVVVGTDDVCEARGATLSAAKTAYSRNCSEPRVDCDPDGDGWVCSSEQIGGDTPGSPAPGPAPNPDPVDEIDGVPQPPSSCSNAASPIPGNILIHNILDRSTTPAGSGRWYSESGNVQQFQLFNGDQNTTSSILRPRVEAFAPLPRWTRGNGSEWHEFSANYYLESWDEPQLYAIFQIKTNDESNFIIQGLIEKDGSLQFARRSKGRVRLAEDMVGKPFNLTVRSNGYKFEVWLDCELVLAESHPQPQLEDGSTTYGWRWGLYRQQTAEDRQQGTTTLYVTGATFN